MKSLARGQIRQLAFDLSRAPQFGRDDFLVSGCNEAAFNLIETWPHWPASALLVIGPPGSGKSHLSAIFAARAGAEIISASTALAQSDLLALAAQPALVVEDADQIDAADEASLFHLFNLTRETRTAMLLTAREGPEIWGMRTADLLSRLRQCPSVELSSPDDELLQAVIVKLFVDHQLMIDAELIAFIMLHIDRSLDAARRFVDLLDRETLARGIPITKSLVRELCQKIAADDSKAG
jgi:chromosomal replication initiation ATPase DnaA